MELIAVPEISVIVLNYQGARWIERCLDSLRHQSIFSRIEVIVGDNASSDGSDTLAERLLQPWSNGRFIQHGENLGYCEGNNRAALPARGRFLFFLNNDAWLEPDCLEKLLAEVRIHQAQAATPFIMDYGDDNPQKIWGAGFDLCGLLSFAVKYERTGDLFMPPGCSFLIERELFDRIGGFDRSLFMYSDELDLAWRVWSSGGRAIGVMGARLHHRLSAQVNPKGGGKMEELRTSDTKRFYANRNGLLVVLKNCQHVLLILVPLQLTLLAAEALVGLVLVRRWSFVRKAYLGALADCWRLRRHVLDERKRIRDLRRRGDIWMLRFLRWRFNRLDVLHRIIRYGRPKVTGG